MNNGTPSSPGLYTDKYETTMLEAALKSGVARKHSVFELFARKLPAGRRYGVVAGTQRFLDYLPTFINNLAQQEHLNEATRNYLRSFEGQPLPLTITGYREGELFFPNSPILTIEGEFGVAVLVETLALSILNHDSAVAAAASRMVVAAEGRTLIEMGSRRTHEDAAVASARAAYMCGFDASSNLAAEELYGVPAVGTSAHAFTLAHDTELEAFKAQVEALGVGTTLLVDTYDIPRGIRNAVEAAGVGLGAIRIDSGDLREETVKARELLDSLGAFDTRIVVSSDLDEYAISELVYTDAPVDSFGAGTRLVTGSGHPTAGMVYKLVAIEDSAGSMRRVEKKSANKNSFGGRKTARRGYDVNGVAVIEVVDSTGSVKAPTVEGVAYFRDLQFVYHTLAGSTGVYAQLQEARAHHATTLRELGGTGLSLIAGKPAVATLMLTPEVVVEN